MKTIRKILSFLLLNGMIAIIVAFIWRTVPVCIDAVICPNNTCALSIERKTDQGAWETVRRVSGSGKRISRHFYIPVDYSLDDLSVAIDGSGVINSLALREGFIFKRKLNHALTANGAAARFPELLADRAQWSLTRSTMVIVAIGIALFEILFVWLAGLVGKESCNEPLKRSLNVSGLIAFLLTIFFVILLPAQIFFGARPEFDTTDVAFWHDVVKIGLLSLMVGTLLVFVLRRMWLPSSVFVLCALFCGYLESGPLSIGLPLLRGSIEAFDNATRGVIDAAVLCMVWVLFIVFRKWISRNIIKVALIVAALICAGLLDVHRRPAPSYRGAIVSDFVPKERVHTSIGYSSHTNVIIIVLDSVTSKLADDFMSRNPEFAKSFSGFIAFRNNVGMHCETSVAMAGLVTGEYFQDIASKSDYIATTWSEKSILADFVQAGLPVFFAPDNYKLAFSNRLRKAAGGDDGVKHPPPLHTRLVGQQPFNIGEIMAFRLAPYVIKSKLYGMFIVGWPPASLDREAAVYARMSSAVVHQDWQNTLTLIHTRGCHVPISSDRYGNEIGEAVYSDTAAGECLWYAFTNLAELFDGLRDKGVYDCSTIVVCADHGVEYDRDDNIRQLRNSSYGNFAFPMLWIKPAYSKVSFHSSDTPTTHSRVAGLIRRSRCVMMTESEVVATLQSTNRLYRVDDGTRLRDWRFDAHGKAHYSEHIPVFDFSSLPPVDLGHEYLLTTDGSVDPAPVYYRNVITGNFGYPAFYSDRENMDMTFRAMPGRVHTVVLTMNWGGAKTNGKLTVEFNGDQKAEFAAEEKMKITLRAVRSNSDGTICLRMSRRPGTGDYRFVALLVEEMQ